MVDLGTTEYDDKHQVEVYVYSLNRIQRENETKLDTNRQIGKGDNQLSVTRATPTVDTQPLVSRHMALTRGVVTSARATV